MLVVYRYRFAGADWSFLPLEVPAPVALVDLVNPNPITVDVSADDSALSDLSSAMRTRGFVFVEIVP